MKEKIILFFIVAFSVIGGIFLGVTLVETNYDFSSIQISSFKCKEPITFTREFNGKMYKVTRESFSLEKTQFYYWDSDCCCEMFLTFPKL